MTEYCYCGLPLHYENPNTQTFIEELIAALGPEVRVTDASGAIYLVPRHYIALHGLKEEELAMLGFPRAA